jgi:hypothetical protein
MHCLSFQEVVWRYPRKNESNSQVAIPEAQTSTARDNMRYTYSFDTCFSKRLTRPTIRSFILLHILFIIPNRVLEGK